MKNATQSRALAQAVARIHWSIASAGMDTLLVPPEPGPVIQSAEVLAALRLVDEVAAELREAYAPQM